MLSKRVISTQRCSRAIKVESILEHSKEGGERQKDYLTAIAELLELRNKRQGKNYLCS